MIQRLQSMDRIQLKIVAATWALGAVVTGGASLALIDAVRAHAGALAEAKGTVPTIQRSETPLPATEVEQMAKQLRILHPGVKFETQPNGNLRVSISAATQYGEWRTAIADMQQMGRRDVVVETVYVCGASCSGAYCSAEFAVKQVAYALSA